MSKKDYAVFSAVCGLVALATFAFPAPVVGIFSGLFGASPSYLLYQLNLGPALPKDARSRLARVLTNTEIQELKTAIHECAKPANSPFCSIVEKYAMRGEVHAQLAIGLTQHVQDTADDKSQKMDWLKVAFAQGGLAIYEQAMAQLQSSNSPNSPQDDGQGAALSMTNGEQNSYSEQRNASSAYSAADSIRQNEILTAHSDALRQSLLENYRTSNLQVPTYGGGSSNLQIPTYHSAPIAAPLPDPAQSQSTRILTPSGPQNYVDQNGNVYAGAGPHGVVNTQTGDFSPTN